MEPLIIYFSSVTENTKKFAEKLPFKNLRLPLRRSDPEVLASQPYVLIVPTYGGNVNSPSIIPKQVIKFLNVPENRENCVGVISAGNKNFGESYLLAGFQVAKKLGVPMIFGFELAGMPGDEEEAEKRVFQLFESIEKKGL